MALQHLRSSTADKRPTPGAMSDGQLAMNTNLASPGLFFKDSNGDSVKIGPVHVGTTAPNATPGAGGQAGNSKGEQWLDTSSSRYVFKIWDGTAWRTEDGEFVNASGDLMTGALGVIAGAAATPGLYFSGDTNTGIYSPSADTLAVSTGGSERMRTRSDGNIGIGSAGSAAVTLYNQGTIGGAATAYGVWTQSTIQSDVTTAAIGYATSLSTTPASFAVTGLQHYSANQGSLGAGSTVTSQYGFIASANLNGATNNYGFFSNLASSANDWNFYAAGTAPSYFAGDIRTNGASTKNTVATDSATAVTLTAASIIDGIRSGTPTASINYTLPTGANLEAAFQDLQSGQSFEWSVINRASVTFNITLVANTNHTVFGNMVTVPASSAVFLTRKSATDTFVTYRIG